MDVHIGESVSVPQILTATMVGCVPVDRSTRKPKYGKRVQVINASEATNVPVDFAVYFNALNSRYLNKNVSHFF